MTATTTAGLADRTAELLRSLGAEPLRRPDAGDTAGPDGSSAAPGPSAARSPVTGRRWDSCP